ILAGNGQVLTCGSNSFGQLGIPQRTARCIVPQVIKTLKEKVMNVAAGLRQALAATNRGLVLQWDTDMASQAKRASPSASIPSIFDTQRALQSDRSRQYKSNQELMLVHVILWP
uniref:Uncharacterized protein n=1 Tax=Ornithorhynchus anatinus TaxID=9258 RepID=A0A6I8NE51_ORNAN